MSPDPEKPMVAMAFKMVEDPYGTLTFMRIYQGSFKKGESYFNQRTGRKERFGRIVRMHADRARRHRRSRGRRHRGRAGRRLRQRRHLCLRIELLPVARHVRARAGHSHGHRAHGPRRRRPPEQGPAPFPPRRSHAERLDRRRNRRDDHRRHGRIAFGYLCGTDSPRIQRGRRSQPAQGQLPRSAHADWRSSTPGTKSKPADRASSPTSSACSTCCPTIPRKTFSSRTTVTGGRVPKQYIPAVEKGFRSMLNKGPIAGYPVVKLRGNARRRFVSRSR